MTSSAKTAEWTTRSRNWPEFLKPAGGGFGLLLLAWLMFSPADPCLADPPTNAPPAAKVVSMPFQFRRGHMMVPARLNGSQPLSFMLDTGFSMTMVNPELAEALKLKRTGQVTILGIAGEEKADVFEGANFDLSGATYSPRRVASLPSESKRRGQDGILGSGVFKRFVIEIDSKAKTIHLLEPKDYRYSGTGEIVPLQFRRDTPLVKAAINIPGETEVEGQFEIDTGCDDGLCLGHDFVEAHRLLERSGQTTGDAKQGVGGGVEIKAGHVPQLQLGKLTIDRPATSFFQQGSPVDRGLAGHIGLDVLRRFKVIFDYSRRQMILEPVISSP